MNWPQTIPAGKTFKYPVTSLDIAPTFIEIAGGELIEEHKFDGVNILPYILEKNNSPKEM